MIVGVLLAAGQGTRFAGGNKLLAEVGGEPVVVKAAEQLCQASVQACLAVVGYQAERIAPALSDLPIETTVNPDYEAGQATSVRVGVEWAKAQDAEAVVIALGDMPWVSAGSYVALLDAYRDGASLVVPEYEGERGNPVVFDREYFDELLSVEGDSGGRQLFAKHNVMRVPVDDAGVRRDIDVPGDLEG